MVAIRLNVKLFPSRPFDQAIFRRYMGCKPQATIVRKGAHNVQPDTKSNNPIPTAPAIAPFLGPNKMDTYEEHACSKMNQTTIW